MEYNYQWDIYALQWRHNGCDSVSNHQPHDCLLNRLFRRRSKKTSKLRVTGLCAGNSPGTGELSAQMATYAENVSIWWRHHGVNKIFIGINGPQTLLICSAEGVIIIQARQLEPWSSIIQRLLWPAFNGINGVMIPVSHIKFRSHVPRIGKHELGVYTCNTMLLIKCGCGSR